MPVTPWLVGTGVALSRSAIARRVGPDSLPADPPAQLLGEGRRLTETHALRLTDGQGGAGTLTDEPALQLREHRGGLGGWEHPPPPASLGVGVG